MPRGPARPLGDLLVTGRPSPSDYRVLTPRTPHSRAGRAEDGLTEIELDELRDGDANEYGKFRKEQRQHLLGTGYRSGGDDSNTARRSTWKIAASSIIDKSPLIAGSILACILLALFAISINQPGLLEGFLLSGSQYLQAITNSSPSTYAAAAPPTQTYIDTYPAPGRLISYENYTQFPLNGSEFRQECEKLMGGFMHSTGFWMPSVEGTMDVMHHDDVTDYHLPEGFKTKVCKKTITYQLDGHVGLTADLALMAQVAALAREVCESVNAA